MGPLLKILVFALLLSSTIALAGTADICVPSDQMSSLYRNAVLMDAALNAKVAYGDKIVTYSWNGDASPVSFFVRSEELFRTKTWRTYTPDPSHNNFTLLREDIERLSHLIILGLKMTGHSRSNFETNRQMANRVLGLGNFVGRALITESHYRETCTSI